VNLSRRWLVFLALLPCGFVLARAALQRMFALWSGSPFDLFGVAAVVIKVALYAGAGGLIVLVFELFRKRRGTAWLAACAALAILIGDQTPRPADLWGYSYVDSAIWRIGYLATRVAPYHPSDAPLQSMATPALPPLTRVDAHTPVGDIQITSGRGSLRTFRWDGVTRSLEILSPETSSENESSFYTRRFGRDGIRHPWYDWAEHRSIVRGEEWEGVKSFRTQADAEAWLAKEQNKTMPFVWTHDGLVVGWSTHVDWRALTVECYQVLVDGRKPTQLAGSDDRDIVVTALGRKLVAEE
jgi:hypothetical protein